MTDWTPEEERVARGICAAEGFNPDSTETTDAQYWTTWLPHARAAISAMQPRWRDVKTDPPPRDGTEFDVWNGYERVVDVFWSSKRQAWCHREYETNYGDVEWTVMPFSHWMIVTPPLPPAPEDKP